jgi:hypothetical protein
MSPLMKKIALHIRDRRVEPSQDLKILRSRREALELAMVKGFFTIEEAAMYIGKSQKTVANLRAQGAFDSLSKRGAGRKLITKKSIDKYLGVLK